MRLTAEKFVFTKPTLFVSIASGLVTVGLAILQMVGWINENAMWFPWALVVALVLTVTLLVARVDALKENAVAEHRESHARLVDLEQSIAAERQKVTAAEARTGETEALLATLQASDPALSAHDKSVADILMAYASDQHLLTMLSAFHEYQIPPGPVQLIRELASLPETRAAYDPELERHLTSLSGNAELWLRKFLPYHWMDGENYSMRQREWLPDGAYKEYERTCSQLHKVGVGLQAKLLAFQTYSGSLGNVARTGDSL